MGIALPQIVTEDRASGAQVIDGSLKFDRSKSQYLKRTPSSAGNEKTFTWSVWIKIDETPGTSGASGQSFLIATTPGDLAEYVQIYYSDDRLIINTKHNGGSQTSTKPNALYRDVSGWYHIVVAVDTTQSTGTNRLKIYVNGEIIDNFNTDGRASITQNTDLHFNSAVEHTIGKQGTYSGTYAECRMSQVYLIDGQALGPESFGFTDPLTNTWRPKKYTGDFNISSSGYAGIFAPYSTTARWNSFKTYTTVNENSTGHTLPMSNPSHYGGKALDLASGGFQIQTNNSAAGDFFMAIWVNLDSYETNKQFGVDIAGNYVFFETLSNGAIKVRHTGSGGQDSNSGYANDTNQWQHWALSRSGGSLRGFVDGEQIVTDTGGISGDNTVLANSKFNFFGADNNTTSYNINGQVIDAVIYIGQGVSGNFTPPTAPLIDSSGNINHYSGFSDSQLYFASPLVDVSGSTPNTIANYIQTGVNSFYLPMDGNSPIGQDKSGQGNNWTPVNFGGSVALDNPQVSGARPILNTDGGGNVARVGVFGSEENLFYTVTTANGSVYQFDITSGDNPSLSFIRGATYKFDYSSFTGHPVLFSSTNPDSSTTAYTDGTSIASNVISFTVPHDAPDTLYYYCQNHPTSMNGSISITTDTKKADPYAWKNVLALPLVGNKEDVSNSVNSGSTTKTITVTNAVASSAVSNFYNGSWYFDGSGDYINASSNSDFTFGTGDFTIEGWIYPGNSDGGNKTIFSTNWGASGSILFTYDHTTNKGFDLFDYATNAGSPIASTGGTYEANAWYHFAVVRSSNTSKIYINGIEASSASHNTNLTRDVFIFGAVYVNGTETWNGYQSDFRVYKGVAKYTSDFVVPATSPDILPDTPSGVSGSSKLAKVTDGAVSFDGTGDFLSLASSTDFGLVEQDWTVECFAYIEGLTNSYGRLWYLEGSSSSNIDGVYFSNTHMSMGTTGVWSIGDGTGGEYSRNKWIHIAVCHDSTNMRMYIDGVQTLTTSNNFHNSSSKKLTLMSTNNGSYGGLGKGFISNFRILKGTALYTSSFTPPSATPLTNVTNTKLLCCQSNTSATEAAVAPGSITAAGDAAATNFNPFNTDINTVRGQESGYATLNPLDSAAPLSDGNLQQGTSSDWQSSKSTIGLSSGRWYWETQNMQDASAILGVADETASSYPSGSIFGSTGHGGGDSNPAWTWAGANYYFNATTAGTGLSNHSASDIVQYALDVDAGKLWFGRNGVWYNSSWDAGANPESGTNQTVNITTGRTYMPAGTVYNGGALWNFGQKPFKFPPPAGFQPLNAANVRPETVITRPDQYVGVTTYSGNSGDGLSTTQDINVGLNPDLIWIKHRNGTNSNLLTDTVRGLPNTLISNSTAATNTNASRIPALLDNGFRVGDRNEVNDVGGNYVAWCWKAGGNKNTFNVDDVGYASAAAAGLDGGTLDPSGASVNTKSKFGIYTWDGHGSSNETLAHGLGAKPDFMICKKKSTGGNSWVVWHKSISTTEYLILNSTATIDTDATLFNSHTNDSDNLWSLGTNNSISDTGQSAVAYLWCDVPGLQKFGSYTGNGSQNFVQLGFRPALVMVKRAVVNSSPDATDNYSSWTIMDFKRLSYNGLTPNHLFANKSINEGYRGNASNTANLTDMTLEPVSNGFYLNGPGTEINANTGTYIYAAWAEAPTFNLYGAQSNAR